MNSLRLFTALRFNNKTINEIAEIQNQLKLIDPKAKFVSPISNFHETLYFIGMVESDKLNIIKESLEEACLEYKRNYNVPILIEFNKLGQFKRPNGNIVWLGVKDNKQMETLAQLIPNFLEKNDISIKRSKFTAHITLARKFKGKLPEKINLPNKIEVNKASLVWSHRNKNNILIYDNIVEYPLTIKN